MTGEKGDLLPGEVALLEDAAVDDVSFMWVLIDLGIRDNPPPHLGWAPSGADVDLAFESVERLVRRGLLVAGTIEYVSMGDPVINVSLGLVQEPLDVLRHRVDQALRPGEPPRAWENVFWVTTASPRPAHRSAYDARLTRQAADDDLDDRAAAWLGRRRRRNLLVNGLVFSTIALVCCVLALVGLGGLWLLGLAYLPFAAIMLRLWWIERARSGR